MQPLDSGLRTPVQSSVTPSSGSAGLHTPGQSSVTPSSGSAASSLAGSDNAEDGESSSRCTCCEAKRAPRKKYCREHQQAYDNIKNAVYRTKGPLGTPEVDADTEAAWLQIFKGGDPQLQRLVLTDYSQAVKSLNVVAKRAYRVNLMQYIHSTGVRKGREAKASWPDETSKREKKQRQPR